MAKEIKRFPLRVPLDDYNRIRVIAFNCRISINRTIGYLLAASLSDERIVDRLYAAHPPGKDQFIYLNLPRINSRDSCFTVTCLPAKASLTATPQANSVVPTVLNPI